MKQNKHLMPKERARITEIQDLLIDRYVEQNRYVEQKRRSKKASVPRDRARVRN
jgi:hypothetical protein